ncbi:GAF domain-containing protein, partial [Xanthomonas sp. Kuri4-2]
MPSPAPQLSPHAEARRLASLRAYGILDTPREAVFDDITRIASMVCQTPISVVNLIDAERQWFKSEVGLGVRETPLESSICAHAILQHDFLEVADTTLDERFAANPLVVGAPGLRFYAGALLKTPDGLPIGTVCVLDTRPRVLDEAQAETLRALARQVMAQLELRKMLAASDELNRNRARVLATAGHDLKGPLRSALYAISRAR